ncbi:hypothetical protein Q8A67_007940 [Cirrhinus molitorella]|nr:hypothetical protein Q8A67_007940 [Cirrhinus molitorella]
MLGFVKNDLSNKSTIDKDLKLTIRKESHLQSQGEDYFAKFQKFHNGYKDNYVENIQPGQVYWENRSLVDLEEMQLLLKKQEEEAKKQLET